jgi:1,4-alpha-glucan branching enzyme
MRTRAAFHPQPFGADAFLAPYRAAIERRRLHAGSWERRLTPAGGRLTDVAAGHEYFGLHRGADGWRFREWAPAAATLHLIGGFSGWEARREFAARRLDGGVWELWLPPDTLRHGDLYRLRLRWDGGGGDRIPAYARRVVQDDGTKIFNAQVWAPEPPYAWRHPPPERRPDVLLVYESHVGMAQERPGVGTYDEYRTRILPRIRDAGYNCVQLMAVAEHPYYGSFGYHVSSFFAASSRFGTPEELKALVDDAHGMGMLVIMDLVHSHAARNEVEGLSRFDGTPYQYFHEGGRGEHPAWDSRCFDYGKPEVLHFLLSNCRFWLDEYRMDGYRFDGVTSLLYRHHGFGAGFASYDDYFGDSVDEDALAYLTLANRVIHEVRPAAATIAEDVSGMPGLAAPAAQGGSGFDLRLAMGVPDCWFKLVREVRDEDWSLAWLWHELTNRRGDERTISYVECHDQAIVGSKTFIFELADAEMYGHMGAGDPSATIDRALALHKLARLCTLATAGHGYLTFMGNEFGHPEWVDFPREGNGWSYHYARRQWSLRDNPDLKYRFLADFDRAMMELVGREGFMPRALRLVCLREADKVMVFERGGLVFLFNFHPTASWTDYPIELPPGAYDALLNSDEPRFGGHARIAAGQQFITHPVDIGGPRVMGIRVYLPARTALVLKRRNSHYGVSAGS